VYLPDDARLPLSFEHDHRTHRPTTTTSTRPPAPHPERQQHRHRGSRSRWRRSITNSPAPPTAPHAAAQHRARAFLRCSRPLYSSQTTTHTPHTWADQLCSPSAPWGAGNQRQHPPPPAITTSSNEATGDQDREEEGPVVSGPNSAPWTSPPPDGTHRSTTTTPPVRRPRNTVAGTGEGPGRHLGCGRLPADIPPMSSPHQEHDRLLGRGRPRKLNDSSRQGRYPLSYYESSQNP
jgi:hypothetical protein